MDLFVGLQMWNHKILCSLYSMILCDKLQAGARAQEADGDGKAI